MPMEIPAVVMRCMYRTTTVREVQTMFSGHLVVDGVDLQELRVRPMEVHLDFLP